MAVVAGHAEAYRWQLNPVERANFIWAGGPMKEKDRLLRRAEKMRRDSLSVRKEASQLTLEIDRQCMMEIAAGLDDGARSLEQRASCPLRTVRS
jgi:hypothetical protein